MNFERQQVKKAAKQVEYAAKLSSIGEQLATVDVKVEKHAVEQVEHAVKLAAIGEQVAAVDAKVDNNLKNLTMRFDTKFDSFQIQMYLAVRHATHPTPHPNCYDLVLPSSLLSSLPPCTLGSLYRP